MTKCSKCQNIDVIKYGFNYVRGQQVQKYRCNSCRTIFSHSDRLPNTHISENVVCACMDMYFEGVSYRVIRNHLRNHYKIKISHVTVYNWIQNYSELIKRYTDSLKPKLSPVWQIDETFIKFKGERELSSTNYGHGYWLWVCIDTGTRFVLDMYLSVDKTQKESEVFFERLKKVAGGDLPDIIATDGLTNYPGVISKVFPNAQHVILKHITLDFKTSFIERLNGTIKHRTKTMRGFYSFYPCQATLTAFKIHYNFLRGHMALKGRTPAQEAGISVEFPQRWASLIRNSLFVVVNNYT